MPVAVVATDNGPKIVSFRGNRPTNFVNYLPVCCTVADEPFLVQLDNGTYKVCKKKKSAWMKEQIKNGHSE